MLRIGISGWRYGPWRGVFYPKGLPQRRELEYASRQMNTVEINGTFYSLQRPEYFREWFDATPDDFLFAVKGGRFITHMKKLRDCRVALANFFAQGVLLLKQKLGPVLWQFPPQFPFDAERFDQFFAMLPRDTESAAKLSREHWSRLEGRAWTKTDAKRPIRHAVEIRHASFLSKEFMQLLRRHNIGLVIADTAGIFPYTEDIPTNDFVYIRLHGAEKLYWSGYTDEQLKWWADRIRHWSCGRAPSDSREVCPSRRCKRRDVYVYFDNDAKVDAPFDAMRLAAMLDATPSTAAGAEPHGAPAPGLSVRESWPALPGNRTVEKWKDSPQRSRRTHRATKQTTKQST